MGTLRMGILRNQPINSQCLTVSLLTISSPRLVQVRIFSRSCEDQTPRWPDAVQQILEAMQGAVGRLSVLCACQGIAQLIS